MGKVFPNTHGGRQARALKERLAVKPAPPMPKKPAPKKLEEPVKQQRALSVQWVILYGEVSGRTAEGIRRDLASEMAKWGRTVLTAGRILHAEYRVTPNPRLTGRSLVRIAVEVLGKQVAQIEWTNLTRSLETTLNTSLTRMSSGPKRIPLGP